MNKINDKVVKFRQDFNTSWMLTEWLRYKYNSNLEIDNLINSNKLANRQKQKEIEEIVEKISNEYESEIDKLNKEIDQLHQVLGNSNLSVNERIIQQLPAIEVPKIKNVNIVLKENEEIWNNYFNKN